MLVVTMDFLSLFPAAHHHGHAASFLKQILLFLLLVVSTSSSSQFWHQSADRSALLSFKSHIENDPLGALSSWNDSLHHCRWHGITCSRRHRERVTVLDLPSQGLEGTLSPYIGNLTFLRRINLNESHFHGEIPQEFGHLFRLGYLNLNVNLLSGEISAKLSSLSKLEVLGLASNNITGVIPSSLGNLSSLKKLSLIGNQLEGRIPDSLCRIRSLEFFQVGYNKLTGQLPSCLYNLSNIYYFGVHNNQLEGSLPPNLGLTLLPNIQQLYLFDNKFHGQIPVSLFSAKNLEELDLISNSFSGEIPTNFTACPNLTAMYLAFNNITGVIPSSLGNLSSLKELSLIGNQLEGRIPDSLCRIRSLEFFQVGHNKLTGQLPSCLYNLQNITYFGVNNNQLEGSLPPNLGLTLLPNIQGLYLSDNKFHGEIPVSLFSTKNLEELDLSSNSFSGEIPTNFTACPNLTSLGLSHNHLTGNIPSSLGNLSSLIVLSLLDNRLEGRIPRELCRLQNILGIFQVSHNDLTGDVPSCFYNSSSMEVFDVGFNQLEGRIPPHMSSALPNIKEIWMNSNNFSGPLPISFSNSTKLEVLEFDGNNFIGSVPRDLGRLPRLRRLDLGSNQLVENDLEFITGLTNCSSLEFLSIYSNFLKGALPESIANMSTHLRVFNARYNRIHGNIPVGFGNLVNIEDLRLGYNNLTGNIPTTLGKLKNLEILILENNRLSGEIPTSLGNMTKLSRLNLFSNKFSGHIPQHLGNCKNLIILDLIGNKFTHTIPNHLTSLSTIVYLYLDDNFLTGSLPSNIGNLTKLVEFSVSRNKLSNQLPNSLGSCISLEKLVVGNNKFDGEIPKSLSSLNGLTYLDLSRNNFHGEIPKYLEHFPNLLYLNLSFNRLGGEVPLNGVFGKASLISVVGNNNLCGGLVKLKLPLCKQKTKKTTFSLKVVLPLIVGTLSVLAFLSFLLASYHKRLVKKNLSSSKTLSNQSDKRVSYYELFKATNGFSIENLIGVGSYGSVFKGTLQVINKIVAVKVFNLQREGASKSFLTECNALRNIRHRNLLKVITVCSSVDFEGNDFKALVLDFMPNGSLKDWIHPRLEETQVDSSTLNFIQRLKIVMDVSFALEYLHHRCQPGIAHCDVKPSNVLLDNEMNACVADFGISKIFQIASSSSGQGQDNSVAIKGTIGYVAPEYGMGGGITTQGDVYSFGILLLEMFTKKKPTDEMFLNGLSLHNYAKTSLPNHVMEIIDPILLLEDNEVLNTYGQNTSRCALHECLILIIKLGVTCSVESPMQRMNMSEVIVELHQIMNHYQSTRSNFEESATLNQA